NDSGEISRGNDGPKGSVYTVNLRSALAKAYYVLSGNGEETYRPTFTFFGYRYVELTAEGEYELIDFVSETVGSDTKETGRLETSNELVNKLISNTIWGQRGNYLSIPTDCPQRDERFGWTGDAQAFSVTAAYNADISGFMKKWMQDARDAQSDEGAYSDVIPRSQCCRSENAAAWADAGIIIPYNVYMMYGDKSIIEDHYTSMEKYISQLVINYGMSGPIPRYGDWLAYDYCKNEFISSAYFVHDIDLMIKMSEIIEKEDRAEYYRKLRDKAYNYFAENFMDEDGKLLGKTQTDKVISLAFNLVSGDYAKEIADELEKQIKKNGFRLSTGFLGTYNLCPTLSKYGKDNMAYSLLMQRKEPSWLYSIDQGATTIWERWNSYTIENGFGDVGMNSFNHYAYGSVVEWIYRYAAGIEPVEAGFKKFALQPRVDTRKGADLPEGQKPMTHVKASFESVSGTIESEWTKDKKFTYRCTVPKGTSATLYLPLFAKKITFNGKQHSVSEFKVENGCAVIKLNAGKYLIEQ
ncbi:MAG: family 78 glycoside hydrolase catalytic domain, partial [Clostridia bacterium]|nr:family 78 glycoside hydrolase catalytic domain [Clostridia bacterium]